MASIRERDRLVEMEEMVGCVVWRLKYILICGGVVVGGTWLSLYSIGVCVCECCIKYICIHTYI